MKSVNPMGMKGVQQSDAKNSQTMGGTGAKGEAKPYGCEKMSSKKKSV